MTTEGVLSAQVQSGRWDMGAGVLGCRMLGAPPAPPSGFLSAGLMLVDSVNGLWSRRAYH